PIKNRQRTPGVSLGVNALENVYYASLKSFLRFQGSRPGLFYDLSAGEFCPLRISRPIGGTAVSPADKS
ncbi:MAG: hypothetical protein V3V90_04140, partial [Thermodesulfobacteriota bacterium]